MKLFRIKINFIERFLNASVYNWSAIAVSIAEDRVLKKYSYGVNHQVRAGHLIIILNNSLLNKVWFSTLDAYIIHYKIHQSI